MKKMTTPEWIQWKIETAYGLMIEAFENADPEGMQEAARKAAKIARALQKHVEALEREEREAAEAAVEELLNDIADYALKAVRLRKGEYVDMTREEVKEHLEDRRFFSSIARQLPEIEEIPDEYWEDYEIDIPEQLQEEMLRRAFTEE